MSRSAPAAWSCFARFDAATGLQSLGGGRFRASTSDRVGMRKPLFCVWGFWLHGVPSARPHADVPARRPIHQVSINM